MIKKIFTFLFVSTLMMAVPVQARATASIEIFEQDLQEVTISVQGSTLHVTGANGQALYIYDVAGVRVMSVKVDSADKRYELNLPKGCYIIKVGKTVRKISIK